MLLETISGKDAAAMLKKRTGSVSIISSNALFRAFCRHPLKLIYLGQISIREGKFVAFVVPVAHCLRLPRAPSFQGPHVKVSGTSAKLKSDQRFLLMIVWRAGRRLTCNIYPGAPRSNVQSAPPPPLCAITHGSMVHTRCDRLSKIDPAAPSDGAPASQIVA